MGDLSIITGERIQTLADVSVITEDVRQFHTSLSTIKTKLAIVGGSFQGVLAWDELPVELKRAQVFFVYTHLLKDFFRSIFPALKHPIILLTHNSDGSVTEEFRPFLDGAGIVAWYGQNTAIEHEKLTSLPIGLANAQWKHGCLRELEEVVNEGAEKTKLIYANFDSSTNVQSRQHLWDALSREKFVTIGERKPFKEYLREMSGHRFCVAPPGNGLDCHRTWECLYLGVIPVLKRDLHHQQFEELPILFVDHWGEVNEDYLNEVYDEMNSIKFDLRKLDLGYWRRRVEKNRVEVLRRT